MKWWGPKPKWISSREQEVQSGVSTYAQVFPIGACGKGVCLDQRFFLACLFADRDFLYFKMPNYTTVTLWIKITALDYLPYNGILRKIKCFSLSLH